MYEDKTFNGIKIKQLSGYKNVGELERLYIKGKCEFLKIERVYDDIIKHHTIEIPTTKEYQQVLKDRVIYYDRDGKVVSNRSEIENYLKGVGNSIVEEHKYLDNPGAYRYGLRSLLNNQKPQVSIHSEKISRAAFNCSWLLQYPILRNPSISRVSPGKNKTPVSYNKLLHNSLDFLLT